MTAEERGERERAGWKDKDGRRGRLEDTGIQRA